MWRAITGAVSGDMAVVEVAEPRLDKLVQIHASRSRVGVKLEAVDVHATSRTQAAAIGRLRQMDAVLLVVPAFGGQDYETALKTLTDDFVLADMGPFETRITRAKKDASAKKELPALERGLAHLEEGLFLSNLEWDSSELVVFSALAPITLKPILVVVNADEDNLNIQAPAGAIVASAALEAEVSGLDPDEARLLLQAYGVAEPVLGRVIATVYGSLDLITFFTTSDKESRAWEVRRGATAPEAAGVIHSDLQRGFIRAEVVHYDKLIDAGSWDAAKEKGFLRVEGKDYLFAEGDVTHFRFAV